METKEKLTESLGKLAKSCIITEEENTIGIYMLGFHGNFSRSQLFLNREEQLICPFCLHRTRKVLEQCSLDSFCLGYKKIPKTDIQPFDKNALFSFLVQKGYTIVENYRNGFLCSPPHSKEPFVTVHLLDIS